MANDDAPRSLSASPGPSLRPYRVGVHLAWEAVLVALALAVFLLPGGRWILVLEGQSASWAVTIIGLLALGAGISLRVAVPNLAIGTLAYACARYFLNQSQDQTLMVACLVTLIFALAAGMALVIVVVGLHVPSWAASLGLAVTLLGWFSREPRTLLRSGWHEPPGHGIYVFSAFATVLVIGSLSSLTPPVRRWLGMHRASDGEMHPQPRFTASWTAMALVLSSGLAGIAGILLALTAIGTVDTHTGLSLTALAFGTVLLGGTSVSGRYGIFGTLPAAVLLVGLMRHAGAQQWNLPPLTLGIGALLAGLVASFLLNNRPVTRLPTREM